MPFDAPLRRRETPQKIAVIGSGVSGLSCAWLLSQEHDVVVYEKNDRIGGHSNTVDVETARGVLPVDTGFIVFNEPSYPNFTALLNHLGVAHEPSCMSFGVSMDGGAVEYSGQTLNSVFARRRNAASPTFWKMLTDIPRFHRDARSAIGAGLGDAVSLGDFVRDNGYSDGFCSYFLQPMAAAIWSTPGMRALDYPAMSFFKFFANHGLLQVLNLPEWRTVSGGSRTYVDKIVAQLEGRFRTSHAVVRVERGVSGVAVTDAAGETAHFDQVVIAAHADEARAMTSGFGERHDNILSAFQYQSNRAVLHFDERLMPLRRRAWSSWNYLGDAQEGSVSYWMNRLQNLACDENIFVTLNPATQIDPAKIVAAFDYDHPMFNAATARAQADIWDIQGEGGVWFAGAHLGHGFHEDGVQAGLAVAEAIGGVRRPWTVEHPSGRLRMPGAIGVFA